MNGMEYAADTGLLILRLVVGLTIASHGFAKFFGKGGINGVAAWFDSIGMRPGKPNAIAAASMEVLCGLGLAFGVLTVFPAAGIVAVMLVAIWTAHRQNGFFATKGGWEYNLVLATVAVSVATIGAGLFSFDGLFLADFGISRILSGWWALLLSLGLGLAGGTSLLLACYRPPKKDSSNA